MAQLKLTLILFTLFAVICALPHHPKILEKSSETKIVGGEPAKQGEIPYQIKILPQACGGSFIIINGTHLVLTAAHCVDDVDPGDELYVVAGELNLTDVSGHEQRRNVTQIVLHEGWNWLTSENDIALLQINQPFIVNEDVAPIPLPRKGQNSSGDVLVSGWGDLSRERPDVLQKVQIPIVDDNVCRDAYEDFVIGVTPSMLCAGFLEEGGKDSCSGDSGGPVRAIDGGYLAGIVSWADGCALPGRPGVNTKVSYFIDWIESNARNL